eukprot:352019-Chlamydomonas_euryale.AAC.1
MPAGGGGGRVDDKKSGGPWYTDHACKRRTEHIVRSRLWRTHGVLAMSLCMPLQHEGLQHPL